MRCRQFSFSLLSVAIFSSFFAHADVKPPLLPKPTQTDFGGVGLIQMPNGRANQEGEFTVGTSLNSDYYHYFVSLQLMPWLESTIRYTRIPDHSYSNDEGFSGDTIYTDKGIDVKLRLLEESYWLPETSIGIRDLGGTGLFDGEFIAMSKRFGKLDTTLGIGWGYIGNSANLLGSKSSSNDCGRNSAYKGKGGSFDYSRWFTGCASVFGGLEYQTPFEPLVLKLEYDGNDYAADRVKNIQQDSPLNAGIIYRLDDWATLVASYERGNMWTFGFTLNTNFNQLSQYWSDTPKPAYVPMSTQTQQSVNWSQVSEDLKTIAGYSDQKIYLTSDEITVVAKQGKYRDRNAAHDRAATILLNTGLDIYQYTLIEKEANLLIAQTNVNVKTFRKVANQEFMDAKIQDATVLANPNSPRGQLELDNTKNWSIGFAPVLQQSIGGSEDFYLFNLGIGGGANYWFNDNIQISGGIYVNIVDNYDKFLYNVPPDGSQLKRVRTLIRQYINDNPLRINNLQLTGFHQFDDNIYTQAYAGYLETMFAGFGGEVLYRPLKSAWALGLDLNYVGQRDPDSPLGLFKKEVHFDPTTNRDYRVQTGTSTGHLTAYYRPEFFGLEGILLKASAGKYLAEDKGITLDFSKQFESGVIAGAYMAKTNLSAKEFGEGSFNKGFYLSIPFDLLTVKPSTSRIGIAWSPLSRDGGQMLTRKYHLYDMTNARDPKSDRILPRE